MEFLVVDLTPHIQHEKLDCMHPVSGIDNQTFCHHNEKSGFHNRI